MKPENFLGKPAPAKKELRPASTLKVGDAVLADGERKIIQNIIKERDGKTTILELEGGGHMQGEIGDDEVEVPVE